MNREIKVIVDHLFDWEVYSGKLGNVHWRIILTPEGQELNVCHDNKFDRWANSDYIRYLPKEISSFSQMEEEITSIFESLE